MVKNNFEDDKYKIIHEDISKLRARPSQVISAIGEAGVFHLCKELIDNASDEALKKSSPCDSFTIELTNDSIRVYDNGRGIPTDIMQEIYETMQAGTNMEREGGATRGANGLGGSTCLVAFSSYFKAISTRPQEKKRLTLIYKEGVLVDRILEEYNGTEHGMDVMFKPSHQILGVSNIPIDDVVNWIKDLEYTLGANTNVTYIVNGKSNRIKHKTLEEYFDIDIPRSARLSNVLTAKAKGVVDEEFMDKHHTRHFKIEFAIVYADPTKYTGDDLRQSWMNMIYTIQNGVHVDGVVRAFMKYMTDECVKKNKKLAGEDIRKDILAHLQVVVKGDCDMAHLFSSQAKHYCFPKSLGKAIEDACYKELSDNRHSAVSSMVEVIIGNHRARIAGEQARDIKSLTRVKKQWTTPDSFIPCSSIKTEHPKELFIVEGNSAGGGLNGARDARYQAILFSKGKPLNVYDVEPQRALSSDSWKNHIPVLGCGVGDAFDIRKLKYDKIIITTDADIDGYHIRILNCIFFLRFLPEIIKAGKLYIAEPPLYKLVHGKDVQYVATQTDYINSCIKSIGDLKLEFPNAKSVKNISTSDFVTEAFDYLNTLKECSINRSVNRYMLEYIAYGIAIYGSKQAFIDNIDKWLRSITSVFKEIGYDRNTNQVYSVIDLTDNFVLIDDELIVELGPVIDILQKYGLMIHYVSNKRNLNAQTEMSHFFECIEDMYPHIKARYKGLGSSDPEVLREVVMDPRCRRIHQVTIEDAMTYAKMAALCGTGKDNVNERKQILMDFKFTKADIDS